MKPSKRERLKATLAGEASDRPAMAFWRHFYDLEQTIDGLVDAMVAFQRRFDWDFLKINPRACYHFEDWGNRYEFTPDRSAGPRCTHVRIREATQWPALETLDPTKGVIGEHVGAVRRIRAGLGPDVPAIMTVFTPLSIAAELAGDDALTGHIASDPDCVRAGLETITRTFAAAIEAFFDAGVDGIFYATRGWGCRDQLTEADYDAFSRPYDRRLMQLMSDRGWLNVFHVCRSNNMLRHLLDLPVEILNWDATDSTNPSIADIAGESRQTVCGGVDADRLDREGPGPWLERQLREAAEGTGTRRWIVGAGCTAPATIADDSLDAVRELVGQI